MQMRIYSLSFGIGVLSQFTISFNPVNLKNNNQKNEQRRVEIKQLFRKIKKEELKQNSSIDMNFLSRDSRFNPYFSSVHRKRILKKKTMY